MKWTATQPRVVVAKHETLSPIQNPIYYMEAPTEFIRAEPRSDRWHTRRSSHARHSRESENPRVVVGASWAIGGSVVPLAHPNPASTLATVSLEPESNTLGIHASLGHSYREILQLLLLRFYFMAKRR